MILGSVPVQTRASQASPTDASVAANVDLRALAEARAKERSPGVSDDLRFAERSGGVAAGDEIGPSVGPAATVELSEAARARLADQGSEAQDPAAPPQEQPEAAAADDNGSPAAAEASAEDPEELSDEEQEMVRELKDRDREVRAHENAHASVGGAYAGAPSYTYQSGPDGGRYAIGGEVKIDVSEVPNDPQKTIDKMRIVQAAAMAPAEPSSADRQVAARAASKMAEAQAELNAEATESLKSGGQADAEAQSPEGVDDDLSTEARAGLGQNEGKGSDDASVRRSQVRRLADYRYTPPAPGQLLDAAA